MDRYKEMLKDSVGLICNLKNFDLQSFAYNFWTYANRMNLFYNIVGKKAANAEELSKITYKLKNHPRVGQVAYFCLETSYPKEIYNAHWCFIIQDFGNVLLVAPTVSVKRDSKPLNEKFEFYITVDGLKKSERSILKVNQLMCLDKLRIEENKGYYDTKENPSEIIRQITERISQLSLDNLT